MKDRKISINRMLALLCCSGVLHAKEYTNKDVIEAADNIKAVAAGDKSATVKNLDGINKALEDKGFPPLATWSRIGFRVILPTALVTTLVVGGAGYAGVYAYLFGTSGY